MSSWATATAFGDPQRLRQVYMISKKQSPSEIDTLGQFLDDRVGDLASRKKFARSPGVVVLQHD